MIYMGIGNYYGRVMAYEEEGKYYITLDNYDEPSVKEVSADFYRAVKHEFNIKENVQ